MKYEVQIQVFPNALYKITVEASNETEANEKAFEAFKNDAVVTVIPPKKPVKRFIRCQHCGKKIYLDSDELNVCYHSGYCGCYCSPECYLEEDPSYVLATLDKELAYDQGCIIEEEDA